MVDRMQVGKLLTFTRKLRIQNFLKKTKLCEATLVYENNIMISFFYGRSITTRNSTFTQSL